jgi:chromosome segregation ATPase
MNKLERERIRDLESRFAEATTSKISLEERLNRVDADLEHYKRLHSTVEEQHSRAISRADAAESSYTRALTDYADLQRRAHGHESTAQAHAEHVVLLESSKTQLEAENLHLKHALDDAESSLARHVRTLGEVQLALSAAQLKNDEVHAVWSRSQEQLADHQSEIVQLRSDLEARTAEATAATSKAADLERILKVTQDAHQTAQVLATGGLAEILAVSQAASMRDPTPHGDSHEEKMRAIEKEAAAFKDFHANSESKLRNAEIEIQDVRAREAALQGQLVQLRAELVQAKKDGQGSAANVSRNLPGQHQDQLREHILAKEAAELKIGVMRNFMAEQGVPYPTDAELEGSQSPTVDSTEQLRRQVRHLERQLAQQQDDVVSRSKREDGASSALEALQARHSQLEATHLKAVQYVKGTEKMLRRMKDVNVALFRPEALLC